MAGSMNPSVCLDRKEHAVGVEIRVRGRVQGVGFRPMVWRYARELGLCGEVFNDPEGVLIRVAGSDEAAAALIARIRSEPPPLARIEHIESRRIAAAPASRFEIAETVGGTARTEVTPDAGICPSCAQEILDPLQRRYRYPFANCTHCGPRLSIIENIPFDRSGTTMATFEMCPACAAEYDTPSDRRFHAEAIACHACGPRAKLIRFDAHAISFNSYSTLDDVDALASLLQKGSIVALKGLGGYQLACDATNEAAVQRLRDTKLREAKPFALMARDLDVIRRYCSVDAEEEGQLTSSAAPIVLLRVTGLHRLPGIIAPGLRTLGFMLPSTPLHLLALRRMDRPVVMTSGNLSDEPQIIDDEEATRRLAGIADYALVHDRRIANRVDDSVVRVMCGAPRILRRARGFAPASIALPEGFEAAPDLLALGGELKATFCLVQGGRAVLSQHQGDLEDATTFDDYRRNLALYAELFAHAPQALAIDCHPEYLSAKLGRERAREESLPLLEVQHHHAHVAACLADNARPLDAPPVLGIVLDGLGWGADGTIWGGEFLLADYRHARRVATFKPVAMLGGTKAVYEPWRNLYAHLNAEMSWAELTMNFAELEVYRFLAEKPRSMLDGMLRQQVNAPSASSCGRLFDAVAAAVDICRERQAYEGEAASRLESIVDEQALREEDEALAYPFTFPNLRGSAIPYIEPLAMWRAILGDLILGTPAAVIAARFHKGLARAVVALTKTLMRSECEGGPPFDSVALSGGCFQNAVLFHEVVRRLQAEGFTVLSHLRVPTNDGGLALGQAAVAAARLLPGAGR
jgi:hydrogenase maturation protein HypF